METIKFKTTIKCSGCVAKVTPFLNEALGEYNWEVDYNNSSKVLTVVGENDQAKVVEAVEKAGYKAEVITY
ncbi:MAG: cation transporter [Cyclobacteriaceae bacterium]